MNHNLKLYFDMDGVLADFYNSPRLQGEKRGYGKYPEMYQEGFFYTLPPMPGALAFIEELLMRNCDIWILTQPVKETPHSYAEKAAWIKKYFPELVGNIIMTQDKSHLAGPNRILIDDNIKWKQGWERGQGVFIHFDEKIDPRTHWHKLHHYLINAYQHSNPQSTKEAYYAV